MQDRTSLPKDETVLNVPAPMSVDSPKKKKRLSLLALLLIIVVIAGIVSVVAYQNHVNQVNQTNADNAYLSALSGGGTLAFSDSLSQENGSQWTPNADNTGTCQFEGNAYHIKQQSNLFAICDAQTGTYSDFAFEVQMSIIQGGCGGIVIRSSNGGNFDYFYICETGQQTDSYRVERDAQFGDFQQLPLSYGTSSAIHTGLGQQNTLAVRAVGSTLTLFVNEQQIAQAQDSGGYTQGGIGLAAYPPGLNDPSEIAYTNARLWTL